MNPVRDWIETILRIAREQAEYGEFDRRVQRLLFLFAIEIGQGKRLTRKERERYAKSMTTAEALMALTERFPHDLKAHICTERILKGCVAN